MSFPGPVAALAGGVGGAKLAVGLAAALPEGALSVIVNTADDLALHGLHISPDLDTVMYNLAGLADPQAGWGIAGDTAGALALIGRYGGPTWFRLGDKDLATHIRRTQRLAEGARLTEVTAELCAALGVRARVLPMTDSPVATRVQTPEGELEFQDYFVARGTRPKVLGVRFQGAGEARPSPEAARALEEARAIVICPSNPIVSVGPILAVEGIRERILAARVPRVAVSPIVGGAALKGPAAEMLRSLGHEVSAAGVAGILRECLDGFVLDEADAALLPCVEALGLRARALPSVMTDAASKKRLAEGVLAFAAELAR
ncbi:MAG: 2-phospho-L-lactate transferase [Candidatus Tectomicrobia bacterium RIFCSPLOWO2_12_FULL_69_37]|nr:MAG: 2-phospho-L-lactate transferase [Candidatus Tectomicrobia bacterium RIFCSPLOWO2_12_FULL_69_37]